MQEPPGGGKPAVDPPEDFEWVNVWAQQQERRQASLALDAAGMVHVLRAAFAADAMRAASTIDARSLPAGELELLAEFLADIERRRDALYWGPGLIGQPPRRAIHVLLRRTPSSVPVLVGSALGVLMLVVFSTAAFFAKFAR